MDLKHIDEELKPRLRENDFNDSKERLERTAYLNNFKLSLLTKRHCNDCSSYKNNKIVLPTGSIFSSVMFILGAPTEKEGTTHTVCFDSGGRILDVIIDKLVDKSIIKRDNIYMTNIIKCYEKCINTQDLFICGVNNIQKEINLVKPDKIIAFGDLSISVLNSINSGKEINIEAEQVHGKVIDMTLCNQNIKVLQTYNMDILIKNTGSLYKFYKDIIWKEIYSFLKQ